MKNFRVKPMVRSLASAIARVEVVSIPSLFWLTMARTPAPELPNGLMFVLLVADQPEGKLVVPVLPKFSATATCASKLPDKKMSSKEKKLRMEKEKNKEGFTDKN